MSSSNQAAKQSGTDRAKGERKVRPLFHPLLPRALRSRRWAEGEVKKAFARCVCVTLCVCVCVRCVCVCVWSIVEKKETKGVIECSLALIFLSALSLSLSFSLSLSLSQNSFSHGGGWGVSFPSRLARGATPEKGKCYFAARNARFSFRGLALAL